MTAHSAPRTPQAAELTTATVEIKALTVNGEQVTLSIFRQLYEEPLYDPRTWEPFGTPWCRVNHHPGRCGRDPVEHEHVVWEKGGELRRARVDAPSSSVDSVPLFHEGPEDEIAICVAAGSMGNVWLTSVTSESGSGVRPSAHVVAEFLTGARLEARIRLSSPDVAFLVRRHGDQPDASVIAEHGRMHATEDGCTRVVEKLRQRLMWTETWLERARDRWEDVCGLPQVFIAL